jgi:hypothetical protein
VPAARRERAEPPRLALFAGVPGFADALLFVDVALAVAAAAAAGAKQFNVALRAVVSSFTFTLLLCDIANTVAAARTPRAEF